jgi:hypothetical protein
MPPLHMAASTSSDVPTEELRVLGVPGMQMTFRQTGDGGAEGAAEPLVQGRRGPAPQAFLSVSEPPEGFDRGGDSRTEGQHLSDEQRAQFLRGSSTSRHSSGSDQSSQPSWSDEEDDVKRPASSGSAKSGDSGGLDEFEKISNLISSTVK